MVNLVTAIREKLGFGEFEKIDPNVPQGKKELQISPSDHFAQAATVAVLLGLYKFGETNEGASRLLQINTISLKDIFFGNEIVPVQNVSDYGSKTFEETKSFMQTIADNAAQVLHKEIGTDANIDKVHAFLAPQRHNILVYLSPDLHLGEALHDNILEDRTNKMEGPVSNLMHKIEDLFSAKDSKKKD